ncbi:hypothetical protein BT96DRAFT_921235 [Gymnopus androsaceus JB14]|uniref:Uncharacterized protein n=1 Tax=Gymnopus androsaceus JB14 TaxID=1447944 RepID=A0A6A4HL58_9AGAR|nr:hypothetical protein BT96DRAFT_921235 [Gymnopus androsaceus JB14]
MHRLPKVVRPVLLNTCRMLTVSSSDSSPVVKNFKDWKVKHHPPPDTHIVTFTNRS